MKNNFFNFIKKSEKIGLALSGGGARGFAHIGVFKALEEHGIEFDYIAGTSAGSIIGAMHCAGLSAQEMIDKTKGFTTKDIKTSKIPFMPNKTDGLENGLRTILGGEVEFKDLKKPFCAVAVDIRSGKEIHITSGNLIKAVAASCAVPGFFFPVEFGNYLLFDGGLTNNLPANLPKLHGCDKVVGVDINSTRGQGTNSEKYLDLVFASISIMMKSNTIKGYVNSDVIVQPDLKRFKATKILDVEDMIEEGYKATIFKMNEIKALFGKRPRNNKFNDVVKKVNSKNKMVI